MASIRGRFDYYSLQKDMLPIPKSMLENFCFLRLDLIWSLTRLRRVPLIIKEIQILTTMKVKVMLLFAYHTSSSFWAITCYVICGPQTAKASLMFHTLIFLIFLAKGFHLTESGIVVSIFFAKDAEFFLHKVNSELWRITPLAIWFMKWFTF